MHQELPQTVLPRRETQTFLECLPARYLRTNDPDFSIVGWIAAGPVKYVVELRGGKSNTVSEDAVAAIQDNSIGLNVGFPTFWRPDRGWLAARNESETC